MTVPPFESSVVALLLSLHLLVGHDAARVARAPDANGVRPLQKVRFPADLAEAAQANCMDGHPAGYFIREQDPGRWVLFLQGGGLCVSPADCALRLHGSHPNLGSFQWDDAYPQLDPFDEQADSLFADYSQVWLPYCSSDMWLGMDTQPKARTGGYQMSGHNILATAVDHLLNTTAFARAEEVVFAGTSAGGVGVIHHADWLEARLVRAHGGEGPRFATLALAGMFFPKGWPVLFVEPEAMWTKPLEAYMAEYVHMFDGGFLQEGCVAAARRNGTAAGKCFDVSNVLPFVKGRLFLAENRFDQLQIQLLGLCPPPWCSKSSQPTSRGGSFIRFAGERMNATLSELAATRPEIGIWSPAVFDHDRNLMDYLGRKDGKDFIISGKSVKDAFVAWQGGEQVHLFQDCGADPCSDASSAS